MKRIVVLGEGRRVRGFGLAGATVVEASGQAQLDRAWAALPADTVVLILTPEAASGLISRLPDRPLMTWTVMPNEP